MIRDLLRQIVRMQKAICFKRFNGLQIGLNVVLRLNPLEFRQKRLKQFLIRHDRIDAIAALGDMGLQRFKEGQIKRLKFALPDVRVQTVDFLASLAPEWLAARQPRQFDRLALNMIKAKIFAIHLFNHLRLFWPIQTSHLKRQGNMPICSHNIRSLRE